MPINYLFCGIFKSPVVFAYEIEGDRTAGWSTAVIGVKPARAVFATTSAELVKSEAKSENTSKQITAKSHLIIVN